MAILAQCPICKRRQATKNKICKCGEDLDRAKRSKRVKYSLRYRNANGKHLNESLISMGLNPYSIKDAQDAHSKKRTQKRENKLFEVPPDTEMTFKELADWYLSKKEVKRLASYNTIKAKLKFFNDEFGDKLVADIKLEDLQNYQFKREGQGMKPATVDQDLGKVKAMVNMGFYHDKVSGKTLKVFNRVKNTMKKGSDVRKRILSPAEFESLMKHAETHLKNLLSAGYYTGMRKGEILKLIWEKVDLNRRLISLEAEDTKDREARDIPICPELYEILCSMPNRVQAAGTDNHVFQYKGKQISFNFVRSLKSACKEAGIKYGRFEKGGFIFHDLRHTFNTNMRKAGVPETVIMEITGHSTREMFDRYDTVDEEDTRKAIDQFTDYISATNVPISVPKSKIENKKI